MRRFLLFISILSLTCAGFVQAQYDAQLSNYLMGMGYYNPAVAGNTENLNALALHRQQWLGIKGAPKSFFIMGDMPLKLGKTNHGVGLVVFTEGIGLFRNTHVAGQYAYKHKFLGGTLSIGIQAGIVNQSFNGDSVRIPTTTEFHQEIDGAIPLQKVSGMALDINVGIYYTHKKFYAGFGITHATEPEIELTETAFTFIGRAFNFTAGYNIQTRNPLFELQPSVFLKTDMQSFQADITGRVIYNKMFNGGISWRVNEAAIILLGATFGSFQVGYAYDFPYTPLLKGTSGSHEVFVKYSMKLNKTKTGKNRHKSVRIL